MPPDGGFIKPCPTKGLNHTQDKNMIVSTATPTNTVLTTDEIDMLKWAVNYFNDNYEPHEEATPKEIEEYELQINTLYSALTKVRSN